MLYPHPRQCTVTAITAFASCRDSATDDVDGDPRSSGMLPSAVSEANSGSRHEMLPPHLETARTEGLSETTQPGRGRVG